MLGYKRPEGHHVWVGGRHFRLDGQHAWEPATTALVAVPVARSVGEAWIILNMAERGATRFLASDAYPAWRSRIRAAAVSVQLFSPYLDSSAVHLLGNSKLPASCLGVVTDLSPDSGAQGYRRQLLAVRRLIRQGIEVRSLPRLHAKVLVIDRARVSIGSQNFTSYARRSKETTYLQDEQVNARFLAALEQWHAEATLVSETLIDELLKSTGTLVKDLAATERALAEEHARTLARHEESQRVQRVSRLMKDVERHSVQSVDSDIRRSATLATYSPAMSQISWAELKWDNSGDYQTLKADRSVDFTRWQDRSGQSGVIRLDRLSFYPIVLAPMGHVAFVRVAKTRITYVWRGLVWGEPRRMGTRLVHMRASFPDKEMDGSNLILRFSWSRDSVLAFEMRLRFTGQDALPVDEGRAIGSGGRLSELEELVKATYEVQDHWNSLLHDVFSPVSYPRDFLHEKNASAFFPQGWLRLDLTSHLDNLILLAQPL